MGKLPTSSFVSDQWTYLAPVLTADLTGKTVVVVGANTGLGLEAAKHFARMRPARLILACRSQEKANNAAALIAKQTNFVAEVQLVDLSDFASVIAFAKRLESDPIDILLANAAINVSEYRATKDGWEETVQVNHLALSLIAFLLTPNLVKAAELHASTSRAVIVGSEVHFWCELPQRLPEDSGIIQGLSSKEYSTPKIMGARYFDSKLLNILFTRGFAAHLSPSLPLVTSVVNPGFCATDIGRNASIWVRALIPVLRPLIMRSAEQGSRQLIWACLGPDGKEGPHVKKHMHGAYVNIAEVREPSDFALSKEGWEMQEKIWDETIEILTKIEPSVRAIVDQYFTQ